MKGSFYKNIEYHRIQCFDSESIDSETTPRQGMMYASVAKACRQSMESDLYNLKDVLRYFV